MRAYIISDNIVSGLGGDTLTNVNAVLHGQSALALQQNERLSDERVPVSVIGSLPGFAGDTEYTWFEKLCITSVKDALKGTSVSLADTETVFILATTKGNINLLENDSSETTAERLSLHHTAKVIGSYFNCANKPVVVSSACISGLLAITIANRLLVSGKYKSAVVTGADILSRFVVSGFRALNAMSADICRPFDKNRSGINLGEAAATVVLTTCGNNAGSNRVYVSSDSVTNDANHITGPSRTGAELGAAIQNCLTQSGLSAADIGFISAHGTATVFNDAMEAKAITLAGMAQVPVHSLKGYYGHTLGAAGVLESVIGIHCLKNSVAPVSMYYETSAVGEALNVTTKLTAIDKRHILKTASGFGGLNAAVIYSKE